MKKNNFLISAGIVLLISLFTVFFFQNCSGDGFGLNNSLGMLNSSSVLPVGHPIEQAKSLPSQKILVGGKAYVAALMLDIFDSTILPAPTFAIQLDKLHLSSGQSIQVGSSKFVMQTDGNAVLYDKNSTPLWDSVSHGAYGNCAGACLLVFQNDGNLVVYNTSNPAQITPIWDSGTGGVGSLLEFYDSYPYIGILDRNNRVAYPHNYTAAPNLRGLIAKWILNRPVQYGGSCNPYDTAATSDCGGDVSNADLPSFTDHNSLRESYRLQFCQNILANDSGVAAALEKISITASVSPTKSNITQMYSLFYRDDPPDADTINSLLALNNQMTTSAEPTLERWRAITLQICESPGWQLF